ncbi:MAG: hypothetical protein WC792_00045 [Candidatus Micrarchaeia archaeon]|jgi:hypothetical protein
MAEEIGLISVVLLVFFAGLCAFVVWLLYQFRLSAKRNLHEVTRKMDELEHQYVRIKPEIDELRHELATKVDYDYLEGKMHQLVRLIAARAPRQQKQEAVMAVAQPKKRRAPQ